MTEIGNTNSNAQVVPLRSASVSRPESGTVESSTSRTVIQNAEASNPSVTETNGNFLTLTEGDPLVKAAEVLEDLIPEIEQTPNTRLRIDRDEETGRFIYYNVDNDSGEVVRQFPPENILEFLSSFRDVEGLVLDDEA